jgi:hypothetical protein
MTNWITALGTFTGHSPIKLGLSKPTWVLCADPLISAGPTQWAAQAAAAQADARDLLVYGKVPGHQDGSATAGGNEVFADGSASWQKWDYVNWHTFSYWPGAMSGQMEIYWKQEQSDFETLLIQRLPMLQPNPALH